MDQINRAGWLNAFGDVPPGFAHRVRTTVAKMENGRARVKLKLIPILVFLLLLLAATALALNSLGVLQTLAGSLRAFLQPEAATLVQQNIRQSGGTLPGAAFIVEEAVYDGRQVYALIRVRATDPARYLLMDSVAEPAIRMNWWKNDDTGEGQTFSGNAHATKRELLQANVDIDTSGGPAAEVRSREIAYDGEDLLYTLTLSADGAAEAALHLSISAYNVYRDDLPRGERLQHGILAFSVPLTDARTVFKAATPMDMPLAGMILRELTLEQTPIATYITARYMLNENAADKQIINFLDGIWFEWLDESGNPIPEGNSQFSLTSNSDDTLTLTAAYRAFESIPGSITLALFNGMTKERFDTLPISLTKQGGKNP